MLYLGIVVCFASWAEVAAWMFAGERQAARIRVRYLDAMLKQDVSFFDTDAKSGDIVSSISSDTLLVQDALSEKVHLPVKIPPLFHRMSFRDGTRLSCRFRF